METRINVDFVWCQRAMRISKLRFYASTKGK